MCTSPNLNLKFAFMNIVRFFVPGFTLKPLLGSVWPWPVVKTPNLFLLGWSGLSSFMAQLLHQGLSGSQSTACAEDARSRPPGPQVQTGYHSQPALCRRLACAPRPCSALTQPTLRGDSTFHPHAPFPRCLLVSLLATYKRRGGTGHLEEWGHGAHGSHCPRPRGNPPDQLQVLCQGLGRRWRPPSAPF